MSTDLNAAYKLVEDFVANYPQANLPPLVIVAAGGGALIELIHACPGSSKVCALFSQIYEPNLIEGLRTSISVDDQMTRPKACSPEMAREHADSCRLAVEDLSLNRYFGIASAMPTINHRNTNFRSYLHDLGKDKTLEVRHDGQSRLEAEMALLTAFLGFVME